LIEAALETIVTTFLIVATTIVQPDFYIFGKTRIEFGAVR